MPCTIKGWLFIGLCTPSLTDRNHKQKIRRKIHICFFLEKLSLVPDFLEMYHAAFMAWATIGFHKATLMVITAEYNTTLL